MKQPKSPHLRLIANSSSARERWLTQAQRDARTFVLRDGHLLSDPSLAPWVIEQCAELVLEAGALVWCALPIELLWKRLANLHRFYPQARLIVAHYETLRVFLPWLCLRGELKREDGLRLLDSLERVSTPMLAQAREQLARRVHAGAGAPRAFPRV